MTALIAALLLVPPGLGAEPARAAVDSEPLTESLLGNFSLGNGNDPIAVRADTLEFSYRDRVLTYTGKVEVSQGDLTLRADNLTVRLSESRTDPLQEVRARGSVSITKGARAATGDEAVFNQRERTVQLSPNAVLVDGANRITGERVVVYLDEERFVVEGGERPVQAILYPKSEELPGNEGAAPEANGQ